MEAGGIGHQDLGSCTFSLAGEGGWLLEGAALRRSKARVRARCGPSVLSFTSSPIHLINGPDSGPDIGLGAGP